MTKQNWLRLLKMTFFASSVALAVPTHAQEAFDGPTQKVDSKIDLKADAKPEGDELETLFQREEQEAPARADDAPAGAAQAQKGSDIKELKDLEKLSEFKDVAVIQRRYLPKSQRWELYGAPTIVVNDPFFQSYGLNARLAYYFREKYGVELAGMWLTTTTRGVTDDLQKRNVNTTTLLSPKSYLGVDFKWTPIYGKMTFRNESITPFDLYFSAGVGMTGTNQSSAATLHIGTGQTFALSKAYAFRWDFSWDFYNASSSVPEASTGTAAKGTQLYNNLLLSVGMSWFFPEATYR